MHPNEGNALKHPQEQILVDDFSDLKKIFNNDPAYESYQVDSPNEHCITLYRDGQTKIFIDSVLWQNPRTCAEYLEYSETQGSTLIFVGQAKYFNNFTLPSNKEHIQFFCLPQTPDGINYSVRSLHNLQMAIERILEEKEYVETSTKEIKYMLSISRELNGERNINKLLGLILTKAREVTKADAGSIYTLESSSGGIENGVLRFHLTQNDSIQNSLSAFTLKVNNDSIVGKVVLSEKAINIMDLYKLDPDPSKNPYQARHDKSWDERTGYESHSMLTLPIFDISHKVTGVIQLINRKKKPETTLKSPADFAQNIIPFDDRDVEYALIVAQQAGIALENANLNKEIENLFDGFVNASVKAIEQRDPSTSGHSHRVADLTLGIASIINTIDHGRFAKTHFNEDQMLEIRYASLLHDFGKVGVREGVLTKAKKLYPWELDCLNYRFEVIQSGIEVNTLEKRLQYLKSPNAFPPGYNEEIISQEHDEKIKQLKTILDFIMAANEPTILEQDTFDKLRDIASYHYYNLKGERKPYLQSQELNALSVMRGSLTREEFAEIQSHVTHTYEFLRKIPWGRRLFNVPHIAAKHHEKLDGTGYPTGSESPEIPIQTRMMTIADIFDALTAADRPYKKAVPREKALDILHLDVKAQKLDPDLFEIFIQSKIYEKILDHQKP